MDEAQTAHEARLEELGAAESARERMLRGQAKGRETVSRAIQAYKSMGEAADLAQLTREMCQKAWPAALGNLISMATGKKKGCPASVQREAIKMVGGAIGMAMEAAPGSAGDKPLAEMTLEELDAHLAGMRENVQKLKAIESTVHLLPQQGSSDEPGALAEGQATAP